LTALLDHAPTRTTGSITPAERLRTAMAAVRVSFTWMGTRKTLTAEQRAQAAETFNADGPFLSAAKKLLDTSHPAFRAVTTVRGDIEGYWKKLTLPFPEPGVRLIARSDVESFSGQMGHFRRLLEEVVGKLDRHYGELKAIAARKLGSLYNPADYPESLVGLFDVAWDFPNVEAPEYLAQLNPALYEEECARVSARFEEAVKLAEQAFLDEFAKLVRHLCERLSSDGGEPKVFRNTAVSNLVEFFEKFRDLNVRSNPELDALVVQAQRAVRGKTPDELRESGAVRTAVAAQLSQVQTALDAMLVDRPRRRILRPGMAG
jgi:hypothetical protein